MSIGPSDLGAAELFRQYERISAQKLTPLDEQWTCPRLNHRERRTAESTLSVEADRGELEADFQRQINEARHKERQRHREH
jgi:hypothetical protein